MLIIPEIETVVLQPPRTGTTSLRDAVLKKYPQSFLLYRHMEADGIPFGYTHWRRVCQIRHPYQRLQSMYLYMKNPKIKERTCLEWVSRMQTASDKSFDLWLEDLEHFTSPGIPGKNMRPRDCVVWAGPDQKKSQRLWAEGADEFIHTENIETDAKYHLDVDVEHVNKSIGNKTEMPWTGPAWCFINKYHGWDLTRYGE